MTIHTTSQQSSEARVHQLAGGPNTPATDLRNAALVIEYGGWHQGEFVNVYDGSVCAWGAIDLATSTRLCFNSRQRFELVGNTGDRERNTAACRALADLLPSSPYEANGVPYWNDHVATSAEEVAAKMREAADKWELDHPELARAVTQAELELAGGPAA